MRSLLLLFSVFVLSSSKLPRVSLRKRELASELIAQSFGDLFNSQGIHDIGILFLESGAQLDWRESDGQHYHADGSREIVALLKEKKKNKEIEKIQFKVISQGVPDDNDEINAVGRLFAWRSDREKINGDWRFVLKGKKIKYLDVDFGLQE